jgi:hypothetical protein
MIPVMLARRAHVDGKTLRTLISGERWPTGAVRGRLESALDWPPGEIERRALGGTAVNELARFSELELIGELLRRAGVRERDRNLGEPIREGSRARG